VSDKKSRKELLKREDAFIHAAGQSAVWVKSHSALVVASSVAAIVAVAVVWGLIEYGQHEDARASELYFAATKLKEAPIVAAPEAGATTPSFPSEADRDKATREAFQKVVDEAGHSGVANLARFFVADQDQKLGETDKALAGFLALADALSPQDNLYFLAVERAAYLKEEKGDVEGAMVTWRQLLGSEKRFYSDHALYEMARLHAGRGETDRARELLARLENEYKDSSLQEDVKQLFAVVGRPAAEPAGSPGEANGAQVTP
jgi:tetratricopeptide (TPR) repeat protein